MPRTKRAKPAKAKPKATTASLSPVTTPADPDSGLRYVFTRPVAGVTVNEWTILKVASVLSCARYISTSIAQLDYNVYLHDSSGGKAYQPDDPVDWIIDRQANPEMTAIVFWETIVFAALIWGNGYAEIEFDYAGRPLWMWYLTPDRVYLDRDDSGNLVYIIHNRDKEPTIKRPNEMLHLRGFSWDGLVGYDVARLCREVFGGPIAAQAFANAFFANDTIAGGVLTTDQVLSQTAMERLKADWSNKYQGPQRAFIVKVLEQGLNFQKMTADANESQLVAVQQFQVEQVARIFGVPLTKIGHMLHSGNRANLEEDDRAAYKQCLRPWARKIECEVDAKLLGRNRRSRYCTLHDFSVLLKGNLKDMADAISQLWDRGLLSVNRALDWIDENPISKAEGGDKRFVPLNFVTLDKAGDFPVAPPTPPGGTTGDSPGAGANNGQKPGGKNANPGMATEQVWDGLKVVFDEACLRILRKEAQRAKQAAPKIAQSPEYFAQWRDKLCAEQRDYAFDQAKAPVRATLTCLGRPETGWLVCTVQEWAVTHSERLAERCATNPDTWLDLAPAMSNDLMSLVKGALCG